MKLRRTEKNCAIFGPPCILKDRDETENQEVISPGVYPQSAVYIAESDVHVGVGSIFCGFTLLLFFLKMFTTF